MIILEGADGSGKSTLAQQLAEALDVPVYNIGRTPGTPEGCTDFMELCFERAHSGQVNIQDRVTQISEAIYGAVFGREHVPPDVFELAQKRLLRAPVMVIFCHVEDFDQVVQTQEDYETEEDIQRVADNLMRLRSLYEDFFNRFPHANIRKYDYTTDSLEELIDEFIRPRLP